MQKLALFTKNIQWFFECENVNKEAAWAGQFLIPTQAERLGWLRGLEYQLEEYS